MRVFILHERLWTYMVTAGGYNLNWAWASGWWAGTHAAKEWNQNNDKNK